MDEQDTRGRGLGLNALLCGISLGQPSTDYDTIKYTPGLYWTRGVVPHPHPDRPWDLVRVSKPSWTRESGKDHCHWYYSDGSGGEEITEGDWLLIPNPNQHMSHGPDCLCRECVAYQGECLADAASY